LKLASDFQRLFFPGFDKVHYSRPHLPEEEAVWFVQNNWYPAIAMGVMAPRIDEWYLRQADQTGDMSHYIYEDFRNMLRMRVAGNPVPSRWLFKSVVIHQPFLPALFRVFPDAKIICIRRDPCEVMASTGSLEVGLGSNFQKLDPAAYGPNRLPTLVALESSVYNFRRSLPRDLEQKSFVDFSYTDILADPYACVKRAYKQFGIEFTEEFANKMKQYLAENPKDNFGKHVYNLKKYGLTNQMVQDAFKGVYGEASSRSQSPTPSAPQQPQHSST